MAKKKKKSVKIPKQRNFLVAKAMFRKAGSHEKPYKAKRKFNNQSTYFNDKET